MKDRTDKRASFAVAIWAGCTLFVVLTWLGSFRIYSEFSDSGIPIRSAGNIVGTADAALVALGFSIVALLAAGLISWLTWRTVWRNSRE